MTAAHDEVRLVPEHDASVWLREQSARRIRDARTLGLDPYDRTGPVIVGPLMRPCQPGSIEDRTCDRCGTHVPVGTVFWAMIHSAAPRLRLTLGLCDGCFQAEVPA